MITLCIYLPDLVILYAFDYMIYEAHFLIQKIADIRLSKNLRETVFNDL